MELPTLEMSAEHWQQLYDGVIRREGIPCTADEPQHEGVHFVLRQPVVDLTELYQQFRRTEGSPEMVSVHADVVVVSDTIAIGSHTLRITARLIEALPSARLVLDYSADERAQLELYVQEVTGDLKGGALRARGVSDRFEPRPAEGNLGIRVSSRDGRLQRTPLVHVPESLLQFDSPLTLSLSTSFQLAAGLEENHPDVATSMLRWVFACTQQSERQRELAQQSRAVLLRLAREQTGFRFVPSLSPQIYSEQASAFISAATAYQDAYERFADHDRDIEERSEAAELMLERQKDTAAYVEDLIELRLKDAQRAEKAVRLAEQRVRSQQFALELQKIHFETAIDKWLRDQILKQVGEAAMAVLKIASQLPALFTGISALAAAPEAAANLGEEVAEGVKTAVATIKGIDEKRNRDEAKTSALEAAKGIGEGSVSLIGAIGGIAAACQSAQEAMTVAQSVLENAQAGPEGVPKASEPLEGIATVTGGREHWDVLNNELALALNPLLEQKIPGSGEYKNELEKLVLYGKVVCECRLAYAAAVAEFATQKLQRNYEQRHESRMERYIEKLQSDQAENASDMQSIYQRSAGIKRGIYLAVDNYVQAYFYWALKESDVRPSLNQSVPEMCTQLAYIVEDYSDALDSFDRVPQRFRDNVVRIDDPSVLSTLVSSGTANWSVDLTHPTFRNYDRVRMSAVKVRLLGAEAHGSPVSLVLETSGRYHDRRGEEAFAFISRPLWWLLKYQDGEDLTISGPPIDLQRSYFMPTPFTDWSLAVPRSENRELDLSGVTAIEMRFWGEFIGSGSI